MDLVELQNILKKEASLLGEYELMTKTELANGYCDADESGNERLKSAYWAALLLRYWYKIFSWMETSRSLRLEPLEFFDWLNDALCDTFYYRSWRYPYKAIVKQGKFIEWKLDENGNKIENEFYYKKDPNAPDKSINYFCSAKRGKEYQYYNKDKRRAEVGITSLEAQIDENGDCMLDFYGVVEEPKETETSATLLVKYFLENNKQIQALIIDGIANQDSFKTIKTKCKDKEGEDYISYSHEFNPRKLVKHLNTINQEFMDCYFCKEYKLEQSKGSAILEQLKALSNTKLYTFIKNTLEEVRNNPKLSELVLN